MTLYHGSTVPIEKVDLSKSRPYKDFGRAFYLSDNKQQALDMAGFKAMNITDAEFQYLKEQLAKDLIAMLMEKKGLSMEEAFRKFYSSDTYKKIAIPETNLYSQSPGYVYSYLEDEIGIKNQNNQ